MISMTPLYTKPFRDIARQDILSAGGKGAFLGELARRNFPVPPGFVVCTNAFTHFLKVINLLDRSKAGFMSLCNGSISVEQLSNEMAGQILKGAMPEDIAAEICEQYKLLDASLVAVRSSATAEDGAEHSWAGQLESCINVDADRLLPSIKKCWASLFSPRALSYRLRQTGRYEHIQVAVVVQSMINPDVAGVAFSVNPVTENRNEIVIEAGFGLGEAVVLGQITPDHYVIERSSFSISQKIPSTQMRGIYRLADGSTGWRPLDCSIMSRQKLEDRDIIKLSRLVASIECAAGFPCDIEWIYDGREFYVVQCRPITTLS